MNHFYPTKITNKFCKNIFSNHQNTTPFSYSPPQIQVIDLITITKMEENDHIKLINYVFDKLNSLNNYYPNFKFWLDEKVFPGLYTNERKILLDWQNNHLASIAIIKNDGNEKKICCLRVQPEFQNKGRGIKVFEKSMLMLETNKPLLSISNNHKDLNSFLKIFNYFNFEKTAIYKDLYIQGSSEISFNGILK